MTHTATPWHYISGAVYADPAHADDRSKCAIAMRASTSPATAEHISPTEKDANMRRIVVCVNACEGIASEDMQYMTATLAEVRRERNALVAALQSVVAGITPDLDTKDCEHLRGIASAALEAPDDFAHVSLHMTRDQARALAQCLDFDLEDLSTVTITEDEDGYEDFKRVEQVRELLKEQGL